MKLRRFLGCSLCALIMMCSPVSASPGNLILQVPDWNQPDNTGAPVGAYPQWCSPTAGGNLMGYWEDVMGCTGLTDGAAYPLPAANYPANAGTWQQNLFTDGIIEMGWFMDTGGWQSVPQPFPPFSGSGTQLPNIGLGLVAYAQGSWTDPSAGGLTKTAYPNISTGMDAKGMIPLSLTYAQMWQNYVTEIDAGRPIECSFYVWVNTAAPGPIMSLDGFSGITIETYAWGATDPHSVVGVGYVDITPGIFKNDGTDEWFICQDGWNTTGQYVAVPLDGNWLQNDYVYDVPEPMTIALLAVGGMAMLRKKR